MERRIARHAIHLAQISRPPSLSRLCNPRTQRRQVRSGSNDTKPSDQAYPLTGYYADILSPQKDVNDLQETLLTTPKRQIQPQTHTAPTPPPSESLPKTTKEETMEKARIVFGSRLAGPGERQDEIQRASQDVAGVQVPPKPTEPDNCCMSGCVNCVWDIYREEFEEWTAKSEEAREKIRVQGREEGVRMPARVGDSVEEDGGGSGVLLSEASEAAKDPFADVPVGIREFMRMEKMMKQKHAEQGSKGG